MEKLLRWYNQNRKAFWFRIITIILVGSIIWRIFYIFNSGRKKNAYINKNQINNEELNSISLGSMQSVINKKNTTINKEDIYLIDSFFSYCNSQNVQEAYSIRYLLLLIKSSFCATGEYPRSKRLILIQGFRECREVSKRP